MHQMLIGRIRRTRLSTVEQVGMTSDFSELHDDVHESSLAFFLPGEAYVTSVS
jgi:ABC-type siderophore export system fused ATPase/permease subunit